MNLYAIRHTTTNNYLTLHYGASHWDGEKTAGSPRLFSLTGARAFRSSWARGPVVRKYGGGAFPFGGEEYWYEPEPCGRRSSDLLIIPVTLTFGDPL